MKEYKDIDLDLYKILYIVQKNGSFSKAAEELTVRTAVPKAGRNGRFRRW